MSDASKFNIPIDESLICEYEKLSATYHYRLDNTDKESSNYKYICSDTRSKLAKFGYSPEQVSDMLIKFLYESHSEAKSLLWACYGDIILSNLKHHINPREKYCIKCGRRFIPRANSHRYCDICAAEKFSYADKRIIICQDCGREFVVDKSVRNKKRCDRCQKIATKELNRLRKQRERSG